MLGMIRAVSDGVAIEFAGAFYEAIAFGKAFNPFKH